MKDRNYTQRVGKRNDKDKPHTMLMIINVIIKHHKKHHQQQSFAWYGVQELFLRITFRKHNNKTVSIELWVFVLSISASQCLFLRA